MGGEQLSKHQYPWNVRDQMGLELLEKIRLHPQGGDWKDRKMAWGLMLNSIGHPKGKEALRMVVEDVTAAYERHVPADVVQLFLAKAIEWRNILLKSQPGKDKVRGGITLGKVRKKLKGKVSEEFLGQVFGKK